MIEKIITERLSFLNPIKLEIINESHLHKGHAGNNGGEHSKSEFKVCFSKIKIWLKDTK